MKRPSTPCWVITLQVESPAVQKLMAEFESQGVNAKTIAGVDGRQGMPSLQNGEHLDVAATRWRHLCELTSSEVGCYLAHLRALRKAYDEGLERVCLFEDDVELETEFAQVLAELEQLPEEVEMIRLMGLKIRKRKLVQTLSDGRHQLVRPERGALGAQGYLINRRGMRKLLGHASRVYEPIDKLYDHFWEYDLRLYGVEPHIIYEAVSSSSIIKSNVAKADVPRWVHWLHPLGKLARSIHRHWYLRQHHDEFYPAELPAVKPGRTERMKGRLK